MATKIYFERNGYAEHVATIINDEVYGLMIEDFEATAEALGFDKVTESEEE